MKAPIAATSNYLMASSTPVQWPAWRTVPSMALSRPSASVLPCRGTRPLSSSAPQTVTSLELSSTLLSLLMRPGRPNTPSNAEFGSFLSSRCSADMIYSSLPVPAMYPLSTEYPFRFIPRKPLQNDEAPPYTLTVPAAEKVMSKKFFVWETLDFLRAKLDVVLRKYNYQHPWEPAFELDVICGVNEPSFRGSVYHVNFLARSDGEARPGHTLFFAELGVQSMPEKSSSCSPVYDYIERVGEWSLLYYLLKSSDHYRISPICRVPKAHDTRRRPQCTRQALPCAAHGEHATTTSPDGKGHFAVC